MPFQKQNRLIFLIAVSLTLFGVSQVLWLHKVWDEQREALHQQTNYLFQNTVLALQDSLVQRSMARNGIASDSLKVWSESAMEPGVFRRRTRNIVSLGTEKNDLLHRDSLLPKEAVKVAVFVTTDSHRDVVAEKGLMSRALFNLHTRSEIPGQHLRVFQFEKDTLAPEELRARYLAALDSAGLPRAFALSVSDKPEFPSDAAMRTEPAPSGLLAPRFYTATLSDYRRYLLRRTLPSALFSFFVFGLTTLAFLLIFNNLRQQQKLAEQKNTFVSNMTHELKTPLTTVGVALEALRDFDVLRHPEQAREYLAISQLELERLGLLVDKVLRLSQLDQTAPILRKESLDLAHTVRQVLNAMTLQAKNVHANIHFEVDSQEPYIVTGDRLHLSGVVFNLLDNALKYSSESCDIRVSLSKTPTAVLLKVQDNGLGIASEFQQKIFEKFFRIPTGNIHNVKGHGLGLSYAAQVLTHHSGSIRVESGEGRGSVFIVEIPSPSTPPSIP